MRPIKPRTDALSHPDNVARDCTAGSPKGRESYGDGALIVVGGVTTTHGGWESQPQDEGEQELSLSKVQGMRNAKSRTYSASKTSTGNFPGDAVSSGEPDAVKVCAVSRTERIANRVGRSSGQMTPRRTTNLDSKGKGDKSMSVKRGTPEDVYGVALQRLSDMAKAGIA